MQINFQLTNILALKLLLGIGTLLMLFGCSYLLQFIAWGGFFNSLLKDSDIYVLIQSLSD